MSRLLILLPLLLGACSFSPSADVLKALSGDTASVCFTITTPWGGSTVARTNYPNATVNCGPAALAHGNVGTAIVVPSIKLNANGTVSSFDFQKQ